MTEPTTATPISSRFKRRAALREAGYLVGLLITAGAAYTLLLYFPSRLKTEHLSTQRDTIAAEVQGLETSITTLRRDASALRQDPWTVERALRNRLGYLRTGERVLPK